MLNSNDNNCPPPEYLEQRQQPGDDHLNIICWEADNFLLESHKRIQ